MKMKPVNFYWQMALFSEASPDAPRSFFKLDLKKYAEKCRTFLNFSRAKVKKMFEEMGNKIKLLRYLGRNYKRAKAWEKLFTKPSWRTNTGYLTKVNRYADDGLEFFEDAGEIYVKQADGVIVGKLDPNDVYDPGQMKVLGESSGRHFDPDLAGGSIVKKSWANPTINQSGIDDVSTHVAKFTDPEAIANNNFMINRLEEIKNGQRVPDDFDKRFYTHELEEYSRFENLGVGSGPHTEANYLNSHTASLEAYSINENVTKIYPPEVPFPQYAGY